MVFPEYDLIQLRAVIIDTSSGVGFRSLSISLKAGISLILDTRYSTLVHLNFPLNPVIPISPEQPRNIRDFRNGCIPGRKIIKNHVWLFRNRCDAF